VDCNQHSFGGQLVEKVAEGWGFPYFILKSVSEPVSTMMACPPDKQQLETFVQVRSNEGLLRYNSRLPVVVYVPTGFEVHYRIWTAGEDTGVAQAE
jgi:ecotin